MPGKMRSCRHVAIRGICCRDPAKEIAKDALAPLDGPRRDTEQFSMATTFPVELGIDPAIWDDKVRSFVHAVHERREHLVRVARRFTPCREEAEDIVQEALLRAYRSLPRFRGDAKMSTWLQTIVQNAAHEWLRGQKGRVLVPLECGTEDGSMPLNVPDSRRTPEESCEAAERSRILHRELGKLSTGCRRAVELCVFDEMKQRTAAKKLNVSVVAIKARIFTAKRLLRDAIKAGNRD
jgi:RNA polymerase sigma-70 factor, ECF subfamily